MQDLSRKVSLRLDAQTMKELDEIVKQMDERSNFHVKHTHSDAIRFCIRSSLRRMVEEKAVKVKKVQASQT